MAGPSTNGFPNGAPFYLDPTQQDLLLAALASNNQDATALFAPGMDAKQSLAASQFQYPIDGFDPNVFTSPQQSTPAGAFTNNVGIDESPFADYLDGDTSFDFDNAENSDLMIGSLPGDSPERDGDDGAEKRKSPSDDVDDPDGGGKRREPDDKQAKKPGRKPLTSEPTTKRKAQNRAAQRAFRERKEKHLKDLETKVSELEKASDAANHENGLLKAQVQRLQMELREYRKRLSLNSAGINKSPSSSLSGGFSSILGGSNPAASNFQFEFPRFGGLPGAHILDNGPLAKQGNKTGSTSTARSLSPKTQPSVSSATSPAKSVNTPAANGASRSESLTSLYSGFDNGSTTRPNRSNTDSSAGQSRVFQFNSGSSTHSDSPSASSNSQLGMNSSCDTSPEPSHNSPSNPTDTLADGYVCHGNSEAAAPAKTPSADVNGFDLLANQNGGQFDPTLFGDYRDSQAAIVGEGDFTGGFFNDAFPMADFGSPFHFGDTPAVQKPNPLEEIERVQDAGDDEVVPGEDVTQMLNCHKIWDKLSNRPDFKDGTIDIDNLCSELRAKARCSESGVVVDHKDVEAALQRLPEQK